MPGNSFGELFRVTTAGVSHGPGYVVIIDGCPPGLPLSVVVWPAHREYVPVSAGNTFTVNTAVTGAHVPVDQKSVPFFKTGKEMRERLNRDSGAPDASA